MPTYKYFADDSKSIDVTPSTCLLTPATFAGGGIMAEQDSIFKFFNRVPVDKDVNIVDIGAQTGLYTLYSKFLPKAVFHAFEPFKKSYDLLNENIELNSITNVKTYNTALSNTEGVATLNTCKSHNGFHTMGSNPLRFKDVESIDVKQTTLDSLNIPVDFIKIDTEGWEYNILMGARETIKKHHPVIQMEWNVTNMAQCGITQTQVFNLMKELNYHNIELCGEDATFVYNN